MITCRAFSFAAFTCFEVLASAPITAADSNTMTLVGNVTGVSQTTQPGQPTRTRMAIAVLAGMPGNSTTPIQIAVECTVAMGCYDSWWLSSACTPAFVSASIDFTGGALRAYYCASPHTYGACVEVAGYLSSNGQGGFTVIPDTILSLPSHNCSWKP